MFSYVIVTQCRINIGYQYRLISNILKFCTFQKLFWRNTTHVIKARVSGFFLKTFPVCSGALNVTVYQFKANGAHHCDSMVEKVGDFPYLS